MTRSREGERLGVATRSMRGAVPAVALGWLGGRAWLGGRVAPGRGVGTLIAACAWATVACSEGLAPDALDAGPDARPAAFDPCDGGSAPAWCSPPDAGPDVACAGGAPDGLCVSGVDACGCADCSAAAVCSGGCVDDGACAPEAGEDCTCLDCDLAVAACAPPPRGCVDDGVCSVLTDDCTCPDCAGDRGCLACVDNGECVPFVEGCACADCAGAPGCASVDAGP